MNRLALLLLAAGALAGCERTMKDMYVQPRLGPDAASPLFADGKGSRPPPSGSVPVAGGDLAATSSGRHGRDGLLASDAADAASAAPATDLALLQRGQQRYDIYCAPCHSPLGDGDGMIARRGFPHPPTFHQARLRDAPDRHLFDVVTQGYGAMPPFGDRTAPPDRWAIVAYVRALQLSQAMPVGQLPPELRAALAARAPATRPSAPAPGASTPEAG
jgi:mono/diheme cytochrome c family protein